MPRWLTPELNSTDFPSCLSRTEGESEAVHYSYILRIPLHFLTSRKGLYLRLKSVSLDLSLTNYKTHLVLMYNILVFSRLLTRHPFRFNVEMNVTTIFKLEVSNSSLTASFLLGPPAIILVSHIPYGYIFFSLPFK